MSTLTVNEFYRHLVKEMGLDVCHKKNDNYINIQAEIIRQALEKRIIPVIIIDEANYINNAVLNDLKMLFNFEMDSKDRAVVLLLYKKIEHIDWFLYALTLCYYSVMIVVISCFDKL